MGRRRKERTMKFMLLESWDAERMNAEEEPKAGDRDEESFPSLDDLQARSISLTCARLPPPRRARTVRVREGTKLVTDGPFAKTKEIVGGFDIIECDSLEQAVEIAAAHPVAEVGTIEVRPFWGT